MDDDKTAVIPRQEASPRSEASPRPEARPRPGATPGPAPDAPRPAANNDATFLMPKVRAGETDRATPTTDGWAGQAPVDGTAEGRARSLRTLAWLLPTLAMAGIGAVRASWPDLDRSELAAWGAARSSWGQLWSSAADGDVTSAPYQLLVRLWTTLAGTSDLALRAPSILAMTLATLVTARLANRLAGARVGLLAGLLLVAVPTTSRYAQTAAPEALALLGALLATLALVTLLDRPGAWPVVGYTLALMFMTAAHVATLTVLVAHLVVVVAMRRRRLPAWLLAALVGTAPTVTLLVLAPPTWLRAATFRPGGLPPADDLATVLFGLALIGGVTAGLAVFSLSVKKPAVVFSAWGLLPLGGLYLATRVAPGDPAALVFFALPAWVCLAALTLGRAVVVRGLAVVLLIAAVGLNAQIGVREPAGHGHAPAALAARLTSEFKPGDVVVHGPTVQDGQFGRDVVARYVPADRQPADVLATRPPRTDGARYAQECEDVARCLADAPRVWLIRPAGGDALAGFPPAKADPLRARYVRQQSWDFHGDALHLYTRRSDVGRPAPR